MNITKAQFKVLEDALQLLPQGDAFKALPPEVQTIISEADKIMIDLDKKRKRDNKRTAEYIAEKRKTNPDYAR